MNDNLHKCLIIFFKSVSSCFTMASLINSFPLMSELELLFGAFNNSLF